MNDQHSSPNSQDPDSGDTDVWKEVGQQFQKVGESLAAAIRAARENPQTQERYRELRTGVVAMLKEVSQAMRETAGGPEAQRARVEAEIAFRRARAAGEQSFAEARPHLQAALRELDVALQKWLRHTEREPPGDEQGPG